MYILLVVVAPKVKLPVVGALDVTPKFGALVVAVVPKVRPVNRGADVTGVGNKLGVVVIAVDDPKSKPLDCAGVEIVGVLLNPKLTPMEVVGGVDRAPNVNALDVVGVVPNVVVLPKPKPAVADLRNNNS